MNPTVYIETSIISYLTARTSKDLILATHQQLTLEWWQDVRPLVDCSVSPFVIQEISRGDRSAAQKRLDAISDLPVLGGNPEIQALSQTYFTKIGLPEKARLDATHLAAATWHEMDYLLSWNCKHIVTGRVQKTITEINHFLELKTPILCTPEALMEV